jgi:hypothetical protein
MVYRPSLIWLIAFILNGSVFALFGVLFALGGAGGLAFRIKVDARGISRSAWYGLVVYRDSWEAFDPGQSAA